MTLELVPITLIEAAGFVDRTHRKRRAPAGGLFALGAAVDGEIVAVVIVGRPIARYLHDDYTAEVTRLASDGTRNACSFLYAAAWRAARALGYRKLVTYSLEEEGGASLRGAGFRLIGRTENRRTGWDRPNRPRVDLRPAQTKLRWELEA